MTDSCTGGVKKNTQRLRVRGFSLIEVLIVVGVLAVVSSMTLVMIRGFGSGQHVSIVAETVRTDLGEMRTRARAGEGRASFGVEFSTSTYTLVSVDPSAATTTIRTEFLPQGFAFVSSPVTVLFTAIRGSAAAATILLKGLDNATTSITIDEGGSIR